MKNKPHTKKGFTLVEVMIVVAIIGLLAIIAIPSFYSARVRSQSATCLNNLRQLSYAKDQWAIENNLVQGEPTISTDLIGPYIKRIPECPAGGEYKMNDVAEEPTCSVYDMATHPANLL